DERADLRLVAVIDVDARLNPGDLARTEAVPAVQEHTVGGDRDRIEQPVLGNIRGEHLDLVVRQDWVLLGVRADPGDLNLDAHVATCAMKSRRSSDGLNHSPRTWSAPNRRWSARS